MELVDQFSRQTITVLGDLVADEYVGCEISRVSREAPVLILRQRERRLVPGGGANAVNNLADLGARVLPVGVVGDDAAGKGLVEYFRGKKISTSGIVVARGWPTTTKTRFLAGWTHTAQQQVLRVDRDPGGAALPSKLQSALAEKAGRFAARSSAVIISDYGCGAVAPVLVRKLRHPRITLDSRFRMLDYAKQGLLAATPNEPELEAIHHTKLDADSGRLEALGRRTLARMGLRALLVTRGKDGMVLFERGRKPLYIEAHGAKEAVDVTGAGDTVIAAFTLALAAGASFAEAAHLANFAGGIVVMKRGTATLTREELLSAIRSDASR
jgi:rfaE bifunctional protein kinase chain/domain